jgi:hypothetical protein
MKIQIMDADGLKEMEVERVNVIIPDIAYMALVEDEVKYGTMFLKLSDEGLIVDVEDSEGRNIGTDAFDYSWFEELLFQDNG